MGEGCKTLQGIVPGCRDRQPLCLNWAGCDVFGRDLLDLNEADGELLVGELQNTADSPKDAKVKLNCRDNKINRQPPGCRRVSWGRVRAAHRPVSENGMAKTVVESTRLKSPEYPPTLLELEVQALAKLGVVKLYHDSRDVETEVAKDEEYRKLEIINRFDRERQALSPVPSQQRAKELETPLIQPAGWSDLLELQKVAMLSMKGSPNASAVASTSAFSSIPLAEGSDLLELQKMALSSMKRTFQILAPPSTADTDHKTSEPLGSTTGSPSNVEGDLLELQKVALASMRKLAEVLESHSPTLDSGEVPELTAGGDLLKLQQTALTDTRQDYQPPLFPVSSTVQDIALPSRDGGCDLLELEKAAFRSLRSISEPPSSGLGAPEKIMPGGGSRDLKKVAKRRKVSYKGAPAVVSQQAGGGDLLELQRLALKSIQTQTTLSPAPQYAERVADFQDLRKKNLPSILHQTPPQGQLCQQGGQDLLELQPGGSKVIPVSKEGKSQWNTEEGGGGTSSSSSYVFNKMIPDSENLDMLLRELSSKEKALQFASTKIEEKDQLLQEYEASLANALNLLHCMNVRCTDAKEVTAKVLTEAEEIFGNLREACSAVKLLNCPNPQSGNDIHSLEGPNTAAPDKTHFLFATEDGMENNEVDMDERRTLVEELLRELGNIEVARKEAQQGFEWQIQKNQQLIVELQQLDMSHPVIEGTTTSDRDIPSSDQGILNQTDHAFENQSDQEGKRDLGAHLAYSDPIDHAKEPFIDLVHGDPSGQPKRNMNDEHVNRNPADQAKRNLNTCDDEPSCDHQAIESNFPRTHIAEIPQGQAGRAEAHDDSVDRTRAMSSDHIFESPSDEKANKTLFDHVFENREDISSDHHMYEKQGDKPHENQFDHVYDNLQDLSSDDNECYRTYDQQANETKCDRSYARTNEKVTCDHEFESSSESPTEDAIECLRDSAYEGKDCSHAVVEGGYIVSTSFKNLGESDKQQLKDSQAVESEVSAKIVQHKNCVHPSRKRPNLLSRVTSPNALWEHLQHFVRKEQPQDCYVQTIIGLSTSEQLETQSEKVLELETSELKRQLEQRTNAVTLLQRQINEIQIALSEEQEARKALAQKAIDIHSWQMKADLQHKDKVKSIAEQFKMQEGEKDVKIRELKSQLEYRTNEVSVLHEQINEMRNALVEEQEARKALAQKAIDIHPWPTKADLEYKDKVIRKMHFQLHQLEAALRHEREEFKEALAGKVTESSQTEPAKNDPAALALLAMEVDRDNLNTSLHSKDEQIREVHEKMAQNHVDWEAEKHRKMKIIDDLETKLLVKEEEAIKLSQELEIARSLAYSQRPDELRFKGESDVHFFCKQGNKEERREILDLRCEVLSLQDCLAIKTQAIKTMEKELARSYSIVTELRNKIRGVQDSERNSQRKGGHNNTDLIERLSKTEEKLQRSINEKALMHAKIEDLSSRCNYLEEFEHLHKEGSDDKKDQAIMELEKELERNVQLIENMQARCNEYEARAKRAEVRNHFDPLRSSNSGGAYNAREPVVIASDENDTLIAECDKLRSEVQRYQENNERKGDLLDQLEHDLQNLKKQQIPIAPGVVCQQRHGGQRRSAAVVSANNHGRPKDATKTMTQSTSSPVPDLGNVESADVNTLRDHLRREWRVQTVMEDRINSMMAYVTDRVNEFEREHSDATSDSSFAATTELNHFHVEAKLMKLQLERQLEVLRGPTFTSLPTSGIASPPGQWPPNSTNSTQNLQLLVEKNALEDSAQTLQEKTSRLLNRLQFMRTEFNPH